jgi:hypothetical protein
MRAFTAPASCLALLLAPLAAPAQGTLTTDPNAAPQGRVSQPVADTQANAEKAFREAQARCRGIEPAAKHQECVKQALDELGSQTRTRRPGVVVRPASAPAAASAASR